mmetsp:Transcript_10320/g.26710  ORF Transcript_10320/g.26710 Transcript_10320/m.26710 type:complete len:231 (-) Transcript_10320:133-825(-)
MIRRAIVVTFNASANLGLVLGKVVVVEAHILDDHVLGADAIGPTIVHTGDAAVVLRATLRLEGAAAAERAVVAGPDGVDALVADAAHGDEAAEHEAHSRGHHVLRMTVVHEVVSHATGRQEEGLLPPVRRLRGLGHVVRVAGPNNRGVRGDQQLLADLENASRESVDLPVLFQRACDSALGGARLGSNLDRQRRGIRAAGAGLEQVAPSLVWIRTAGARAQASDMEWQRL